MYNKTKWDISPFTIVSYQDYGFRESRYTEFLRDTYYNATSFAAVAISGYISKELIDEWQHDMITLCGYHIIDVIFVSEILKDFNEDEQDAIIDDINNTLYDRADGNLSDILYSYVGTTSWCRFSYNEVGDDDDILMTDKKDKDLVFVKHNRKEQ